MTQHYIKKTSYLKLFIVGSVFGLTLSFIAAYFDIDLNNYLSQLNYMMLVIALIITIILSIAAHELGHLIFGLISGYKFNELNILGFKIKKDKNRLKFNFDFKLNKLFGGMCVMFPPKSELGKHPFKLIGYGGIISNLILMISGLFLLFISKKTYSIEWGLSLVFVNFILVVENIRYNPNAPIYNDGTQIKALAQSKQDRIAHHIILLISEDISNKIPFTHSIQTHLQQITEFGDSYYQLNLVYLKYFDEMVHDNVETAYSLISAKEDVALQQTTVIDTMILAQISYLRLIYDFDGEQYFDIERLDTVLNAHEDWLLLYTYYKIIEPNTTKENHYRNLIFKEIDDFDYDPLLLKYYQRQMNKINTFIP